MKSRILSILSVSLALAITLSGCVRNPSSSRYQRNSYERNSYEREVSGDDVTLPTRSSIKRTRTKTAESLPAKVEALESRVERAYRRGNVTAGDLDEWVSLLTEYYMEYTLTVGSLTDSQCESIEYNFGRIAGYIYKDTVNPILDEIEDITDDLEDYDTRSEKWEGIAEKGFEDASGISLDDID